MGTIANAKVTHYYNCYNGDFIGCLHSRNLITKLRPTHVCSPVCLREPLSPRAWDEGLHEPS